MKAVALSFACMIIVFGWLAGAASALEADPAIDIEDPGIKENSILDGVEYKVEIVDGLGAIKIEDGALEVKVSVSGFQAYAIKVESELVEVSASIGSEAESLVIEAKEELDAAALEAAFFGAMEQAQNYFQLDAIWGFLGVDDVLSVIPGTLAVIIFEGGSAKEVS